MSDLGKLALAVTADPTGFEAGLRAAAGSGESMASRISRSFANMGSNVTAVMGTVAASPLGIFAFGLAQVFNTMVELEGQSRKLALEQASLERHFNLTNLQAAGLQFQAMGLGQSIEEVQAALGKFAIRLGETALSGNGTKEALDRIGLSADELRQVPTSEALARIGDQLNQVTNAGERAALMHTILGRSGHSLNGILRQGTEGMRNAQNQAEGLGLAMGETAQKARQAELAMKQIAATGQARLAGLGAVLTDTWAQLKLDFGAFFTGTTTNVYRAQQAAGGQGLEERVQEAERLKKVNEQIDRFEEETERIGLNRGEIVLLDLQKLDATQEEIDRATESVKRFTDATQLKAYKDEWYQIGNQMEQAKDAMNGMGAEEQKVFQLLREEKINLVEAMNLQGRARDLDLLREMNGLLEQSTTPVERFHASIDRLNEAWERGIFGDIEGDADDFEAAMDRYQRAADQITKRFLQSDQGGGNRLAAGLSQGSSEAISLINQANVETNNDPVDRVRQLVEQSNITQNQQLYWQRQMAEAIQEGRVFGTVEF
jgi:hypothetical protein